MSDIIIALGRILVATIFIWSGVSKLLDIDATASYIAARQVPAQIGWLTESWYPTALAWTAATVEIAGGLMVALGFGVRLAALALIAFTFLTIVLFHDFWNMTGQARVVNSFQVLKNLSIIGALMMLLGAGAGPYSIGPNGALGFQRRDPWDRDDY